MIYRWSLLYLIYKLQASKTKVYALNQFNTCTMDTAW